MAVNYVKSKTWACREHLFESILDLKTKNRRVATAQEIKNHSLFVEVSSGYQ